MDVAELTVSAALFLVPGMLGYRLANGFLVRDLRRMRRDRKAEPVFHAVEGNLQMHVALPRDDEFARVLDGLEGKRRILVDQTGKGAGQLHLIGPLFGVDGLRIERSQRRRPVLRFHAAGRRQHVARVDRIHAREGDDLARASLRHLLLLVAQHLEHAARPLAIEGHAFRDLATPHTGEGKLAGVGGVQGLEDLGHGLARGLDPDPLQGLCHLWRLVAKRLEQTGDPILVLGGTEQNGDDMRFLERARHVLVNLVGVRHLVLEELFEKRVVEVGHRLEHLLSGLFEPILDRVGNLDLL